MAEMNLQGRTIAVPESREQDLFVSMLERRGARVLRYPLVGISDAPDSAPVLEWLHKFNQGLCDDLILLTGEGLRRLLSCLERHEPHRKAEFLRALEQTRKIARGPKPGRVLREFGFQSDWVAEPATTEGVIGTLRTLELRGHTVGVQLYGTEPNRPLLDFLESVGAIPLPVAPYVYSDSLDESAVLELVEQLASRQVDAIAFTSLQQVERLLRVAQGHGQQSRLLEGLAGTCVAAIGPIVAEALNVHGIRVDVMPKDSYFLKPLTTALIAALTPQQ